MSDELHIPPEILDSMQAYVEHKQPPGSFLEAVLTNNLKEAVARADPQCEAALGDIVRWFYWEAPSTCWGSVEKVRAWLASVQPESASPD